jgi:hypothetical protein
MLLTIANSLSRSYSRKYSSWYVREVSPGNFQPWAHDSGDNLTVAAYMSGVRVLTAYEEEMKEGA